MNKGIKFDDLRNKLIKYAKRLNHESVFSEDIGHDAAVKAYMQYLDEENPMFKKSESEREKYAYMIGYNAIKTAYSRNKYFLESDKYDIHGNSLPEYVNTVKTFNKDSNGEQVVSYDICKSELFDGSNEYGYSLEEDNRLTLMMKSMKEASYLLNDKEKIVLDAIIDGNHSYNQYRNKSIFSIIGNKVGIDPKKCYDLFLSIKRIFNLHIEGKMSGGRQCSFLEYIDEQA